MVTGTMAFTLQFIKSGIFDTGITLVVQWLGLRTLNAKGLGLIPGQETMILQTYQCSQRKKS